MLAVSNRHFSTAHVLFPHKYKLVLAVITGCLLLLDMILRSQSAQEDRGSTSAHPDL